MKEYQIYKKYEFPEKPIESPFDLVSQALYTKSVDMLNLEACKAEIAEVFQFIDLRARFNILQAESENKILVTYTGFQFEGFKFETLDEIEKALKNKAFL